MTPSQAAKILGYRSVRAVRNLIHQGKLGALVNYGPDERPYYWITDAQLAKFQQMPLPGIGRPRGTVLNKGN